ncbi:MAG: DUF922 domain-containing protein [Flavobacteriales bacterium]
MRLFILSTFIFLLATASGFAQNTCKHCLEWNENRKLTWADFKGKPNKLSRNEALTDSGMSIGLACDDNSSEVTIRCFFDPKKSWAKDERSEYLLAHEQLHFDITELFVRKLRKQIDKLGDDCDKLNKYIEKYYNENYKDFVKYQHAYDSESRHSIDKEKQAYWEKKVALELEQLKPYASSLANN